MKNNRRNAKNRNRTRLRRKTSEQASHYIEYYHPAFKVLHRSLQLSLDSRYYELPRLFFGQALKNRLSETFPQRVTWNTMFSVLEDLEQEIARVLARRSPFFWVHVYRRLKPVLPKREGGTHSWVTASLVRDIVESAIQKFSSLDGRWEFKTASKCKKEEVMGGWFETGIIDSFDQTEMRNSFFESVLKSDQLVLVDFAPQDLEDIYYVEGLAYRYWEVTAKLRALGKGADLIAHPGPRLEYSRDEGLRKLIQSYDLRIENHSAFEGSSLGVWTGQDSLSEDGEKLTLTFQPNTKNADISGLFKSMGLEVSAAEKDGNVANYLPASFDSKHFCEMHAHLAEAYSAKTGFSLQAIALVFQCLGTYLSRFKGDLATGGLTDEQRTGMFVLQLCKRAYCLADTNIYSDFVESAISCVQDGLALSPEDARVQTLAILDALTLSSSSRGIIGLWSRGPRFPILSVPGGAVFDLYGISRFFYNLFVGVREPSVAARGFGFEERLRKDLKRNGFALERRDFKFSDGSRGEADAVFYIGTTLVVVDCLSMWMPLDFEISRPSTMDRRKALLAAKIEKCIRRVEKLKTNPAGRNFDFSGAGTFVALIASPFVEWIWADSSDLWLDANAPRIMRAGELISWAVALREKLDV